MFLKTFWGFFKNQNAIITTVRTGSCQAWWLDSLSLGVMSLVNYCVMAPAIDRFRDFSWNQFGIFWHFISFLPTTTHLAIDKLVWGDISYRENPISDTFNLHTHSLQLLLTLMIFQYCKYIIQSSWLCIGRGLDHTKFLWLLKFTFSCNSLVLHYILRCLILDWWQLKISLMS